MTIKDLTFSFWISRRSSSSFKLSSSFRYCFIYFILSLNSCNQLVILHQFKYKNIPVVHEVFFAYLWDSLQVHHMKHLENNLNSDLGEPWTQRVRKMVRNSPTYLTEVHLECPVGLVWFRLFPKLFWFLCLPFLVSLILIFLASIKIQILENSKSTSRLESERAIKAFNLKVLFNFEQFMIGDQYKYHINYDIILYESYNMTDM